MLSVNAGGFYKFKAQLDLIELMERQPHALVAQMWFMLEARGRTG